MVIWVSLGVTTLIAGFVMIAGFVKIGGEDACDIGLIIFLAGLIILFSCFIKTPIQHPVAVREAKASQLSVVPREEPKPNPEKEVVLPDDDFSVTTEDEIECLARLITAEIGYSNNYDPLDYEEIAYLCGSVVINRIKSDKFPNTLEEVIYQPGQYQCVSNGHINREYDDVAWEIAEELLLYGTTVDPSVVYQSEFTNGSGVFRKVGNQYFCYE